MSFPKIDIDKSFNQNQVASFNPIDSFFSPAGAVVGNSLSLDQVKVSIWQSADAQGQDSFALNEGNFILQSNVQNSFNATLVDVTKQIDVQKEMPVS